MIPGALSPAPTLPDPFTVSLTQETPRVDNNKEALLQCGKWERCELGVMCRLSEEPPHGPEREAVAGLVR